MTAMFPAVWTRLDVARPSRVRARRAVRGERGSGKTILVEEGAGGVGVHLDAIHSVAARREPEHVHRFSAQGHKDASGRLRRRGHALAEQGGLVADEVVVGLREVPPGGTALPPVVPHVERLGVRLDVSVGDGEILHGDAIQPDWGVAPGVVSEARGDGVAEGGKAQCGFGASGEPGDAGDSDATREKLGPSTSGGSLGRALGRGRLTCRLGVGGGARSRKLSTRTRADAGAVVAAEPATAEQTTIAEPFTEGRRRPRHVGARVRAGGARVTALSRGDLADVDSFTL